MTKGRPNHESGPKLARVRRELPFIGLIGDGKPGLKSK